MRPLHSDESCLQSMLDVQWGRRKAHGIAEHHGAAALEKKRQRLPLFHQRRHDPFSNSYHDGGLDVFRTAQGRRIFFVPFGAIAAPSPPFRDSQANHPIRRPGSRRSRVLPGIYQVTVSISAIDVARCDLGLVWKMEFVWRTFLALLACTIAMR